MPNRDKPKDKAGREVSTQGKVLARVVKKSKVTLSKDLKAGREQARELQRLGHRWGILCSLGKKPLLAIHSARSWEGLPWWSRLQVPNAGGQGLIPGQGTRSHMLQVKIFHAPKKMRGPATNICAAK